MRYRGQWPRVAEEAITFAAVHHRPAGHRDDIVSHRKIWAAHLILQQSNFAVARIVAETPESLRMKFPELTVNIKEIARKYHRAELEEEKNIGKSKRKQLTTEAKRNKGSKKDEKTAPKRKGAKKSARGKPAWE
jgi:hypothetical protein